MREGEIVCIAGIDGNGQTEFVYGLTGLEPVKEGTVTLCGQDITNMQIRKRSILGMSHIPEDRHKHGLVLDYTLEDNLVLQRYFEPQFVNGAGFLKRKNIRTYAEHLIDQYDVRSGQGPITLARAMSGGNQQKAIIAREIDSLRILTALCTGDLVEQNETAIPLAFRKTDQTSAEQWRAASRAFERLDNKLPYVVCTGNHDYGYTKSENRLSRFPDYFPMTRNECWRHKIVSVCNNAHGIPTLENAAYEFHTDTWGDLLVVSLEFAPRDEAIEWARKLVAEPRYANTRVILLTHSFIAWKGNRKKTEPYELTDANYQQAIWDKLVYPSSNIRLVICGHECHPTTDYFETVGFRTDKNAAGKSVAQMMFNAQTADGQWHGNGGDCWLRIMEFMPDGKTIKIKTFSPLFALSPLTSEKAWRTDSYDQFDITIE